MTLPVQDSQSSGVTAYLPPSRWLACPQWGTAGLGVTRPLSGRRVPLPDDEE